MSRAAITKDTGGRATILKSGPGHELLKTHKTNEIFVAIVGPAGAGAGTAASILKTFFQEAGFDSHVVKASSIIRRAAEKARLDVPSTERKTLAGIRMMQDRGDELRKGVLFGKVEDHSAVARLVLREISTVRATAQGSEFQPDTDVVPDGTPRAYIIDSLRHPAEVHLLRQIYQDAFTLLGIVCDPSKRERRIRENLFDRSQWGKTAVKESVRAFLERDEDAPEKYGQHVSDTFHESDFFVDNSEDAGEDLSITGMNDQLRRFVELTTQSKIVRPTISETAMHHARSAQMRSACLSRQVGAAVVDKAGNIVATGSNDVPRAGGGLYGEGFDPDLLGDQRCAFRDSVYCSSNQEQNAIISELMDAFPSILEGKDRETVLKKIRSTRLGGLIEFSRAVHAEMDAILSASLAGVSPRGCRMYVTTYPCHYCARHIVAAGIDEVQFIEPYPKSKATDLHSDAITTDSVDWTPPSSGHGAKVLFRPFVGVAPRLYRRVFLKDRDYKDKTSGDFKMGDPTWGGTTDSYKIAYSSLERELALDLADD